MAHKTAVSDINANTIFPLVVSTSRRYLQTAGGRPYLPMCDGGVQSMFLRSLSDNTTLLSMRQSQSFNSIWCHCFTNAQNSAPNADGSTFDSIVPFTGTLDGTTVDGGPNYDLSTVNSAYLDRIESRLQLAGSYGMCVFFDLLDCNSYQQVYLNNSLANVAAMTTTVVNRLKKYPNWVGMVGNDFQSYATTADATMAQTIQNAMRSADPSRLQTLELNYLMSGSSDSSTLQTQVDVGAAYTYWPTYYQVYKEYSNAGKTYPLWMQETFYENATPGGTGTTVPVSNAALCNSYYWSMLAGALAGYWYGSTAGHFQAGWQSLLSSTAVGYLQIWQAFFNSAPFYKLVPDNAHIVVTAGYGTATGNSTGSLDTDTYCTTAWVTDGSLSLTYVPSGTGGATLTVDLTKFRGTVTAQTFDPTTGLYTPGGTFSNSGTHNFAVGAQKLLRLDA